MWKETMDLFKFQKLNMFKISDLSGGVDHIQHNHTYHLTSEGPSNLTRPLMRDKHRGEKSILGFIYLFIKKSYTFLCLDINVHFNCLMTAQQNE